MVYLFVVLLCLVAAVGSSLAYSGGNVWACVLFTVAAVTTMQLAYLVTAILLG